MISSEISIPIAFMSGMLSFFAPCVLPLLPVYVSYITGISLDDLKTKGYAPFRKRMIISSLLYILGFSLVFTLLGITAGGIGRVFRANAREIQIVSGVLLIVFGLEFSGFLNLGFLAKTRKFKLPKWSERLGHFKSFLVGVIFAVTWTPCVGAILGSILALSAVNGSAALGGLLLFTYSLGISLPFLFVSFTLISAPKYLKIIQRKIGLISKISSGILIILGILLITGTYAYLNTWVFDIAYELGYEIR